MWILDNEIDRTIDRLLRYAPETAERLNTMFLPNGDSYLAELVSDGCAITIKSYDWSNNRFYNIIEDLNITVKSLEDNENDNWATICFGKGLIEILSILIIDMEIDNLEVEDVLNEIGPMIDVLSRHLDVSVSMCNIDRSYIEEFRKSFVSHLAQSNVDIDSDTLILGWVSMNGSIMYLYDGTIK